MSRIQAIMTVIYCHQNSSQLKKRVNNNTSFRKDTHDTEATGVCETSGSNSSAPRMISKELPKENISQQQKRGLMET